jgi:Ca-activated chloride channel family protein
MDPLRYQTEARVSQASKDEIALLRLRYKLPASDTSQLLEQPIQAAEIREAGRTSVDFRFASAVAGFGQLLRGGRYTGHFGYAEVLALARSARGPDAFGYRGEFISLVNLARSLDAGSKGVSIE